MIKDIISSKSISVHKRRMDRGGIYVIYFQMFATAAILVRVFNVDKWWVYVLGGILLFSIRYILGYWDEKKKILAN